MHACYLAQQQRRLPNAVDAPAAERLSSKPESSTGLLPTTSAPARRPPAAADSPAAERAVEMVGL